MLAEKEKQQIGYLRALIQQDEWDLLDSSDDYARGIIAKYLPDRLQTCLDLRQSMADLAAPNEAEISTLQNDEKTDTNDSGGGDAQG